jgi:hypothetical protein
VKYIFGLAAVVAILWYLGSIKPESGSPLAPVASGADFVNKQISEIADKAADKAIQSVKDSAADAAMEPVAKAASWLVSGADGTGLRGKSREELEAAGLPEEQVDNIRYESMEWAFKPKNRITNEKELNWRESADAMVNIMNGDTSVENWRKAIDGYRAQGIEFKIPTNAFEAWLIGFPKELMDELNSPAPPAEHALWDTLKGNYENNKDFIIWPDEIQKHSGEVDKWREEHPVLPEFEPYYEPLE